MNDILASSAILLLGLTGNVFDLNPHLIRRARKKMDAASFEVLTVSLGVVIRGIEAQSKIAGELTKHEKRALRKLCHIQKTLLDFQTPKHRSPRRQPLRAKKTSASSQTPE